MKPMFKYPGGKSREIEKFKEFYPQDFDCFVEPFVGGGAVFFDSMFEKNIIADINEDLISFYAAIRKGLGIDISNLLKTFKNNKDFYYKIRDEFIPSNEIEKATKFFYLRKTCFRGLMRYNKSGKFNVPYGNYKTFDFSILEDEKYIGLLEKTKVLNLCFKDVFDMYNDGKYFFFIDPPYHTTFSNYSSGGFNEDEHILLSKLFKQTKSKCLMIIGKTDFIVKLYEEYIINEYNKKYAINVYSSNVPNSTHLIIKNF